MERKEIFFDNSQYGVIKRGLNIPLQMAKKVALMIADAGFQVTKDNVTDCLLLEKEERKKAISDNIKYVGQYSEIQTKMYECETVFIHNEHLKAEFESMLQKSLKGVIMPVFRKEREDTARDDFWMLQSRIYNVTHSFGDVPGLRYFLRWFDVVNDEVILPENVDELIRAEATIYADDEQTKEILQLHDEAVDALNKLMEVFAFEDLDVGFIIVGNKVARRPINYKLYL